MTKDEAYTNNINHMYTCHLYKTKDVLQQLEYHKFTKKSSDLIFAIIQLHSITEYNNQVQKCKTRKREFFLIYIYDSLYMYIRQGHTLGNEILQKKTALINAP